MVPRCSDNSCTKTTTSTTTTFGRQKGSTKAPREKEDDDHTKEACLADDGFYVRYPRLHEGDTRHNALSSSTASLKEELTECVCSCASGAEHMATVTCVLLMRDINFTMFSCWLFFSGGWHPGNRTEWPSSVQTWLCERMSGRLESRGTQILTFSVQTKAIQW